MTVYTTLPTDDENLEVTVIDDPDLVTLNINPAQVTGGTGLGTVTSVATGTGLTGGPITSSGTIAVDSTVATLDGTQTLTNKSGNISQWTNDSGYLTDPYNPFDQDLNTTDDVTFNIVTATNEFIGDLDGAVRFAGRNVSGATIAKGQVIYISGISGNTPEVSLAKADSSTTMPAFGIAIADILNNATGQFATFGSQTGLNVLDFGETGITFQIGDTLYISHTEAGHITNVAPPNENCLIQNIGKIERATPTTNMTIKVGGAGRSNATPNLNDGNIFLGNASNQSVPASLDTSVSALGYITNSALTPYYTSTQVDALPVSTFSNDAGYSTTTGTVTPSSTDTFTNKSGNISQWTNDAGYLTSETDNQTLSFANPNLSISNGNSVDLSALTPSTLAWSAITGTPTTLSGYGITDGYTDADVDSHLTTNLANADELLMWDGNDWAWFTPSNVASSNNYNDLDNLPTLTTINNNGDNRIITGSATADNLNGEADFTWDGNNGVIDGSANGLTTPVMQFKTDNSSWNTGQMMLSDSNDDVCTLVGANRNNFYEYNFTLDPNNTNGRTGATTFAGDYFVAFRKDYSDAANVKMGLIAFGAHGGFDFTVRDDYNSNGQYKGRPLNFNCLETNFNLGPDRNVLALTVKEESIDCKVPIGQARLSSDPANPVGGWTYYNTTTNKLRLYVEGTTNAWVDLN